MTEIPPDPWPPPVSSERSGPPGATAAAAILESELDDVDRRLEAARGRYRRHVTWLIVGISPSAVIPALLAFSEWGGGALVALVLLVCIGESAKALGARSEIGELGRDRLDIVERLEALAD